MLEIKAKKIEMSQIFEPDGKVVPVTLLSPLTVTSPDEFWGNITLGLPIIIRGVSKGKGFAGVVKRHHFKGGPATHGQSDRERHPGSIGGTTTPGRVYKGKRMAGRMGGERTTLKGSRIVGFDKEKNLISVFGPVPGARRSLVVLTI